MVYIVPYSGVDLCVFDPGPTQSFSPTPRTALWLYPSCPSVPGPNLFKDLYTERHPQQSPSLSALLFGSTVACTAGQFAAYPFQLLRTRAQAQGPRGRFRIQWLRRFVGPLLGPQKGHRYTGNKTLTFFSKPTFFEINKLILNINFLYCTNGFMKYFGTQITVHEKSEYGKLLAFVRVRCLSGTRSAAAAPGRGARARPPVGAPPAADPGRRCPAGQDPGRRGRGVAGCGDRGRPGAAGRRAMARRANTSSSYLTS